MAERGSLERGTARRPLLQDGDEPVRWLGVDTQGKDLVGVREALELEHVAISIAVSQQRFRISKRSSSCSRAILLDDGKKLRFRGFPKPLPEGRGFNTVSTWHRWVEIKP